MMCEPLRGWRHVQVSARRTRQDYAQCVQELVEVHYPHWPSRNYLFRRRRGRRSRSSSLFRRGNLNRDLR